VLLTLSAEHSAGCMRSSVEPSPEGPDRRGRSTLPIQTPPRVDSNAYRSHLTLDTRTTPLSIGGGRCDARACQLPPYLILTAMYFEALCSWSSFPSATSLISVGPRASFTLAEKVPSAFDRASAFFTSLSLP